MDVLKKYGMKKSDLIALFVLFILFIIETIISIYGLIVPKNFNQIITNSINLIEIIGVGYYVTILYKKYNHKILSGLFILYSASMSLNIVFREKNISLLILILLVVGLVSYMAGSLEKYKRNIYIGTIVLGITFLHNFCILITGDVISLIKILSVFGSSIIWLIILSAYIVEHYISMKK